MTYMEQGDGFLISLITLHLDIYGYSACFKRDLCIEFILGKHAENNMCLSLIPVSATIHKLFPLQRYLRIYAQKQIVLKSLSLHSFGVQQRDACLPCNRGS